MRDWTAVGIDVSARTLDVHLHEPTGTVRHVEYANTPTGHRQLIRHLTRSGRTARVCLESTGAYGLDLGWALNRAAGIELMVLNPRAARRFAEVLMARSKTDFSDAEALCIYAERMPFEPWQPPSETAMKLRWLARRIYQQVKQLVAEKNRLHAAKTGGAPKEVCNDIEASIRFLDRRIEGLEAKAVALIVSEPQLAKAFELLVSIRGVGPSSALRIVAELSTLPADLTARQWVAHAGLDPRHHQSGTSVFKPARISKAGNKYLRAALYMPAHNAIQFEPQVRAYYQRLLERGKQKMPAKVAVMRKLLHALYGMIRNDEVFDGERFAPGIDSRSKAA